MKQGGFGSLPLPMSDSYIPGDYYGACDVCGFKTRRSQMRRRWDGAMVCLKDFEQRHPQDLIKPIQERQPLRDVRPEPEWTFVSGNGITADDL